MSNIATDVTIQSQTQNEILAEHLKEAIVMNKDILVEDKLRRCLEMLEGLETYLENNSPSESALQKLLYVDSMKEPWEQHFNNGVTSFQVGRHWLSSRHSSQFLKVMAEVSQAERILEIGMCTGYTAAVFCESAFSTEVTTLESEPFLADFVKSRIPGTVAEKKLNIIVGQALDSLDEIKNQGKKFDLVFIDADKENYLNYYNFIMDNALVEPNGLILLDNTLWKGELYPSPMTPKAEILTAVNEFIHKDPRVTQVIVQVCDGISIVKVNP